MYSIFVAKNCKYGIFVAKSSKYGIFVAKIYKYALNDSFLWFAVFLDSLADLTALRQEERSYDGEKGTGEREDEGRRRRVYKAGEQQVDQADREK